MGWRRAGLRTYFIHRPISPPPSVIGPRLMSNFVAEALLPSFLVRPADFAPAYRPPLLAVLHIIFSRFVHYDYVRL